MHIYMRESGRESARERERASERARERERERGGERERMETHLFPKVEKESRTPVRSEFAASMPGTFSAAPLNMFACLWVCVCVCVCAGQGGEACVSIAKGPWQGPPMATRQPRDRTQDLALGPATSEQTHEALRGLFGQTTCCAAKKSQPSLWRLRAVGGLLRCVNAPCEGDNTVPGAISGLGAGAGVWNGSGGSCEKSILFASKNSILGANGSFGPALKKLFSISCAWPNPSFSFGGTSTYTHTVSQPTRALEPQATWHYCHPKPYIVNSQCERVTRHKESQLRGWPSSLPFAVCDSWLCDSFDSWLLPLCCPLPSLKNIADNVKSKIDFCLSLSLWPSVAATPLPHFNRPGARPQTSPTCGELKPPPTPSSLTSCVLPTSHNPSVPTATASLTASRWIPGMPPPLPPASTVSRSLSLLLARAPKGRWTPKSAPPPFSFLPPTLPPSRAGLPATGPLSL